MEAEQHHLTKYCGPGSEKNTEKINPSRPRKIMKEPEKRMQLEEQLVEVVVFPASDEPHGGTLRGAPAASAAPPAELDLTRRPANVSGHKEKQGEVGRYASPRNRKHELGWCHRRSGPVRVRPFGARQPPGSPRPFGANLVPLGPKAVVARPRNNSLRRNLSKDGDHLKNIHYICVLRFVVQLINALTWQMTKLCPIP